MRPARSRLSRVSDSKLRTAVVVTASIVVVGTGIGIAGALLPRATGAAPAGIGPEGTIRLAPDTAKQCQRLAFDNRNGEFRDRGVSACEQQTERDTPIDRMQAIRAWFNRGGTR